MSDLQQIAIYKMESGHSLSDIVYEIKSDDYEEQILRQKSIGGFFVSLFYKQKETTPTWKSFLKPLAKANQKVVLPDQSSNESYVLLFVKNNGGAIYAATGGYGHNVLKEFIQHDFGIDILSRLETKNDRNLKATREISLTSGVLGVSKFFRKDFTLYENQEFGTIYQELKAGIDKATIASNFGFDPKEIRNTTSCIAKNSFKITENVNLVQLAKIIEGCDALLQKKKSVVINNVVKLTSKKNQKLIEDLNNSLFDDLWKRYADENYKIDFDICHRDFEKYLTAHHYIVTKSALDKNKKAYKKDYFDFQFLELSNVDVLFDTIKKSGKDFTDKKKFISFLKQIKITSFDSSGLRLTDGSFQDHLMGDVTLTGNANKFFCLDKKWYQIEDSFIKDLNKSCRTIVEENLYLEDNVLPWGQISEGEYNDSHINQPNTIVFDRVLPENIEVCDIMKWNDETVYLIHVKSGFSNTMRDLCAQIIIAAKRVSLDINSSTPKSFLKLLYQKMVSARPEVSAQSQIYTEAQFLDIFNAKKIVFVLAVLDTAQDQRELRDMDSFSSNIAKFSLNNLWKEIRVLEQVSLQIIQIEKPNAAQNPANMAA